MIPLAPPPRAEALLRRFLPEGVLGLSILGDLREEFDELTESNEARSPTLWYWRSALGLSIHYGLHRTRTHFLRAASKDSHRVNMMTSFFTDLRFSVRMLLKTPVLSLIAILTIGLGVGLTTQTFSAVYGSILRGLPVPGQDRLMAIDRNILELGIESDEMSIHEFQDLRELQTSFEEVAAFYQSSVNLAGEEGPPEQFHGAYMSSNALSHLGVPPILGRTFLPGEDAPGAAPVTVLAHHIWINRFAGDPSILERTLLINGEPTEVVGVMPEGFRFPFSEDIWLTHRLDAANLPRGAGKDLDVFGRLREGVSVEVARAELDAIALGLAQRHPETNEGVGMGTQRYELRFMPEEIRAVMWVMLTSTFGVLLIACANVANLLLARASTRTREVAIRTAIGASRFRVVRQLMVEALTLALIGGALGIALAIWGVELYSGMTDGIRKPFWIDPQIDLPVLIFALVVTVLACLAAGIFPAMKASGIQIGEIIKDQSRGSTGLRMGRFSTALVVSEIAVSCGLLVGAGFMVKSVLNVARVDMGFETEGILTGSVRIFDTDYPNPEDRAQFFTLLKEKLESEPGVASAALGTYLPGMGSSIFNVAVEGESYPEDRDYPPVYASAVSEDYFRTFGVELSQGRDFSKLETEWGADPVVIVNESFVQQYLGNQDALGRRIRLGVSNSQDPWMTVVGVVPDMHVGGGVGGLGNDRKRPERIFMPKGCWDYRAFTLSILTLGPPEEMAGRLREMVAEVDPNLPVFDLYTLDEAIKQATWAFKLFGVQFLVFGGLALFLAAVGLYGVMAFSVSQRRQEMGVRMALGAQNNSIIRLVLGRGAKQLGVGTMLGVALGAIMGGPMEHILYGVETGDPLIYLGVVATLLATGFLACVIPAKAAVRTDPVESMRVN